jgi:hypothetical protein
MPSRPKKPAPTKAIIGEFGSGWNIESYLPGGLRIKARWPENMGGLLGAVWVQSLEVLRGTSFGMHNFRDYTRKPKVLDPSHKLGPRLHGEIGIYHPYIGGEFRELIVFPNCGTISVYGNEKSPWKFRVRASHNPLALAGVRKKELLDVCKKINSLDFTFGYD